jgi:trigger factor
MEIVVPAEELHPIFEKAYREEARKIALPGFRKGKVPLQIVKKRFGRAIEYDVLERISNDFFKEALKERDIKPISQPVLQDIDYKPDEQVTARISYETEPEIVLQQYKNLQLERLHHKISDDDVEDRLLDIRKNYKRREPAETADEEGYEIICDIQPLDRNFRPLPKHKPARRTFDLDNEDMNMDLKAELLNMKVGETKDIEIPVDYHDHDHSDDEEHDHTERYRVHVQQIDRITIPDKEEVFEKQKALAKVETMEEWMDNIRKSLEEAWDNKYRKELEEDLISQLIEHNPVDIPSSLLESMVDEAMANMAKRMPDHKFPDGMDLEPYRQNERESGARYLKWIFLAKRISEVEGIETTEEEVDASIEARAREFGMDKETVLKYLDPQNELDRLQSQKLIAFLLTNSEISDVDDNEFRHADMLPFNSVTGATSVPVEDAETIEDESTENEENTKE